MKSITKGISAIGLGVMLITAPASALAYYPYTWFTGTSYMVGPDALVGVGGYSTGPIGIYSQGASYYSSTSGYNPMTGQFGGGSYSNMPSGQAGYLQYIPAYAQQYVYGYGGYGGYGSYGYSY